MTSPWSEAMPEASALHISNPRSTLRPVLPQAFTSDLTKLIFPHAYFQRPVLQDFPHWASTPEGFLSLSSEPRGLAIPGEVFPVNVPSMLTSSDLTPGIPLLQTFYSQGSTNMPYSLSSGFQILGFFARLWYPCSSTVPNWSTPCLLPQGLCWRA